LGRTHSMDLLERHTGRRRLARDVPVSSKCDTGVTLARSCRDGTGQICDVIDQRSAGVDGCPATGQESPRTSSSPPAGRTGMRLAGLRKADQRAIGAVHPGPAPCSVAAVLADRSAGHRPARSRPPPSWVTARRRAALPGSRRCPTMAARDACAVRPHLARACRAGRGCSGCWSVSGQGAAPASWPSAPCASSPCARTRFSLDRRSSGRAPNQRARPTVQRVPMLGAWPALFAQRWHEGGLLRLGARGSREVASAGTRRRP
jgi:hypothetical protein